MKVKSESEVAQSCLTLRDPMDCSLPGSSIHGIFQGRVLEWVTIAFSMSQTSESNGSWPQGIQSRPVVTYTCSRVRCVFQRPPQITYPQLHLLLFTYLLPFSFHSFNRIHFWSSYHAGSQMGLPQGSQLLLLLAPGLWSWSTALLHPTESTPVWRGLSWLFHIWRNLASPVPHHPMYFRGECSG